MTKATAKMIGQEPSVPWFWPLLGDDDQIVPIADSALLSAKLVKNATLKVYPGLPHGMCTTHPGIINRDLLAFIVGARG
jgi:non-heme chloroperoxidase